MSGKRTRVEKTDLACYGPDLVKIFDAMTKKRQCRETFDDAKKKYEDASNELISLKAKWDKIFDEVQ